MSSGVTERLPIIIISNPCYDIEWCWLLALFYGMSTLELFYTKVNQTIKRKFYFFLFLERKCWIILGYKP